MKIKYSKILSFAMSVFLAVTSTTIVTPITAKAFTDADVTSSIELGKGFNLLSGKMIETQNLSAYEVFKSNEGLSTNRTREGSVDSELTYITDMSSYIRNTTTNVSASVDVHTEFILAETDIKTKFGFSGQWSSSDNTKKTSMGMSIKAKAYQYALNMGASDLWGMNADGSYKTFNDQFMDDLISLNPKAFFNRYGTHLIT
ncbi:MAG: hypothetical protein GX800_02215, partial [Clostridiaceae bacterium]|nr:hypothetical protein [Clostridiaceae bacterium]